MPVDADEYQRNAEEAFHEAEMAVSPDERAHWLRVAKGWIDLAALTED